MPDDAVKYQLKTRRKHLREVTTEEVVRCGLWNQMGHYKQFGVDGSPPASCTAFIAQSSSVKAMTEAIKDHGNE